jgi:branched-chain amino acid transport system substrate-binding protein
MWKTKFILTSILLTVLLGAGCVGNNATTINNTTSAQKKKIKIGALVMQTGDLAQYGANTEQGIKLALDKIKKEDKVEIEMVYEDTKCDAKSGATAANKLVNSDKVDMIIAFECSGPTFSAAPIAQQNKTVLLSAIATAPNLGKTGEYIYRISPSDEYQGKDLANAVKKNNFTKVAFFYLNNTFGQGVNKVFQDNFNGEIVATEAIATEAIELKTQLIKIKNKNPEAIVMVGFEKEFLMLFKQMKELGVKATIFGTEGFKDEKVLAKVGSLAEGSFVTSYSAPSSSLRATWESEMKTKYGSAPGAYADFSYDAMMIVGEVAKNIKTVSSDNIKDELKSLNYNGVTGLTRFDSNREVMDKTFTLYQVKNGKFVEVK